MLSFLFPIKVYFDGHTDTVNALRDQWTSRVGEGLDAYDGMKDPAKVNEASLRKELGYVPPKGGIYQQIIIFLNFPKRIGSTSYGDVALLTSLLVLFLKFLPPRLCWNSSLLEHSRVL